MQTQYDAPVPNLFPQHPHLSDLVYRNLVQSEIEGGVYLHNLEPGTELEIETQNRTYTLINRGGQKALICGHPEFCPEPVEIQVHGSTWGGSMLKHSFIGRGMRLEFQHPAYEYPITTSFIVNIRALR